MAKNRGKKRLPGQPKKCNVIFGFKVCQKRKAKSIGNNQSLCANCWADEKI